MGGGLMRLVAYGAQDIILLLTASYLNRLPQT